MSHTPEAEYREDQTNVIPSVPISVIIPVHNAREYLSRCLDGIRSSIVQPTEIIVVDDVSTDGSAEIAREKGAQVFVLEQQGGPAAARNRGAASATGHILLFLDADVVVKPDTIALFLEAFENPDVGAVFASYDDTPAEPDFPSQYRNLFHHFIHQQANVEAATFWAGCGAVRRQVFHAVGGFDAERYPKSSIEDIEFGYRLKSRGYKIVLEKTIQVTHLKRWNFYSIVKTDIFNRAIPWSKLMLEQREIIPDLNLRFSHRVSAGLVGLLILTSPLLLVDFRLLYGQAALLVGLIGLNHSLYRFFLDKRGINFTLQAFVMHSLYYCYSGLAFVACWLLQTMKTPKARS